MAPKVTSVPVSSFSPSAHFDKKLAAYMIVGAAAFSITGIAKADIVYTDAQKTVNSTSPVSTSYTFNLSGPSAGDITITATSGIDASTGNAGHIQLNGGNVAALLYGASIDPSMASAFSTTNAVNLKMVDAFNAGSLKTVPVGDWPANGSDAYLGFYFDSVDGSHAGWADISTSLATASGTSSFTVKDYAYDTVANEAITAGQGRLAATPEPSTLSLLALGGAGLIELRRRRKANA